MHLNIKEYLDKQKKKTNEKEYFVSSPGNTDATNNIFSTGMKSTSKEKNRNLLDNNSNPSVKDYKKVVNDPEINNYINSPPKNTSKKPDVGTATSNNNPTICLCNKLVDESLFERNKCKLCGKNRMEMSLKANPAREKIEEFDYDKQLDQAQGVEKIQVNNFTDNRHQNINNQTFKKVEQKNNLDQAKYLI